MNAEFVFAHFGQNAVEQCACEGVFDSKDKMKPLTHFACRVDWLKYLRGFQNERNKFEYRGNQSSGCRCWNTKVSPGQPLYHPVLPGIPV